MAGPGLGPWRFISWPSAVGKVVGGRRHRKTQPRKPNRVSDERQENLGANFGEGTL